VPTVSSVRGFSPLHYSSDKAILDGLIRAGFEIRKKHRTEATVGTGVCCSLFTVRRSPFGLEFGFGVWSLGSEFCILPSQFYLPSSVQSVDRIRKTFALLESVGGLQRLRAHRAHRASPSSPSDSSDTEHIWTRSNCRLIPGFSRQAPPKRSRRDR
jgi:hypothetical protein